MLSDSLSSNFRLTLPVAEWPMAVTCLQLAADLRKVGSRKASTTGFHDHIPRPTRLFTKLSFTTPQIGSMAALVDVDGMTHQDAAVKWLADNEDVWKPWTESVLGDTN